MKTTKEKKKLQASWPQERKKKSLQENLEKRFWKIMQDPAAETRYLTDAKKKKKKRRRTSI